MADLKTTAKERARLRAFFVPSGHYSLPNTYTQTLLDDLDTLLAENARLRAEVERLRGEVASLALLVNPQAARDAAQEARENRAVRAILATREGDDLVGAATNAMAMTELYKAMWRRDQAYAGLARQAMCIGLAECERLRGEVAEQRVLLRWFLDGDDHTHEDDCGARGSHDLDVCRAAPCRDDCEGPHCACGATEMRARALAALEAPLPPLVHLPWCICVVGTLPGAKS